MSANVTSKFFILFLLKSMFPSLLRTPINAVSKALPDPSIQDCIRCESFVCLYPPFSSSPSINKTATTVYPNQSNPAYIDHSFLLLSRALGLFSRSYLSLGAHPMRIWEFFNPPSNKYEEVCKRILPVILTIIEFAAKS